jgi:hypothetical protein
MFRHRPIAGFFVKLVLLYGVLIAPWPYVHTAYLACYRAAGNFLFHSIGPAGGVRFESQSPPDNKWATKLTFKNRRTGAEGVLENWNTRHEYLTMALVTALIVATPIPWARRWRSLLFGLVIAGAILAAGIWLSLVDYFCNPGPLAQFALTPSWTWVLKLAVKILASSPEVPFAVPVFIWLLVTLRRGDVQNWLNAPRSGKRAATGRGASGS